MEKVARLKIFLNYFLNSASSAIFYQIPLFELNRIKLMSANFTWFAVFIPLWP